MATVLQQSELTTAVEAETQRIGRELWEHLSRRTPTIFERRWWDDRILSWAMSDESVKVQMFRFVDVLPMLKDHRAITRHLQEYFEEVREHLPFAARIGLDISQPNSVLGRALALNARSNALRMAERFIAGSNVDEVLQAVGKIRKMGFAFTLDLLGEAVMSEAEADRYQQAYLDLISGLAPVVNSWPENGQLDRDHAEWIPRVNVSLKLTALYSQFAPIDPRGTLAGVAPRLRTLLRAARDNDAFINVDMEQYAYKDLTLEIFKQVLLEDEFRDYRDVGIVVQAYLPDAERDLRQLLAWAQQRGTPIWVRLVKGAYWDYETVLAGLQGWPIPVYQRKWQSDHNFERQTRFLMENHRWLRPALGSHNLRSLAHGVAWAKVLEVPEAAYEIQMLYGMGGEQAQLFSEMGHRVRVYTPFGELIPGMAYLVRRLLENTSNDSFLRQSFTEHISIDNLLRPPTAHTEPAGIQPALQGSEPMPEDTTLETETTEFQNEPVLDFSQAENRDAMQQALEEVGSQLGGEYPLVINGRRIEKKSTILSRNPSHPKQIVGIASAASKDDAVNAIEAARNTYRRWSQVDVNYRAEYLEMAAREMRTRRFELAAWEVYECGKPWAEADADIAEAIDFCMYYAKEMRRLAAGRHVDLPGEENEYFYRPRGVAVIIAPWNFPLAILCGMTAAALVAGNTVVMKPAEQSPVIAAKLFEILEHVGIPDGAVNYLPGIGEEVGPELVGSPDVDVVAFTGSQAVGLEINARAADTDDRQQSVKRVIAEMGGKNAIIIDDDADLDEAVAGVVSSAFGYAGQKCSACSRAIVLDSVYDTFVERLVEATRSLKMGPAVDPGTKVGPIIDEGAYNRLREFIAAAVEDTKLALPDGSGDEQWSVDGEAAAGGYFVPPHIFTDVPPNSPLAQQELFGPVLAVIRVQDLDEAFEVANGTDYALTGGIFSRSPANLQRARQEFRVGNLYLNRGITGALVHRQPFGGFKMSGIGSKAGGPDYLQQFLIPVNITENTMRRGFAPQVEDE